MMKKVAFALLVGLLCLGSFQTLATVEARSKSASGQRVTGAIVGIGGRFGGHSRPFTLIVTGHTAPVGIYPARLMGLRASGQVLPR